MKRALAVFSMIFVLVSCKTAEEALRESGHKPLSATEVKSLISGNTLIGETDKGFDYIAYYRPDGTAHLKSKKFDEKGKWRVDQADGYCSQWTSINDGKEQCRRIYKVSSGYQFIRPDGSDSSTFTIEKGNTKNL